MALAAGPIDRRTRYVDINAILGEDDPVGVLTKHFQSIYKDPPAERREDQIKQKNLLFRARVMPDNLPEKIQPDKKVFSCHPVVQQATAVVLVTFDKWVIYTDGGCLHNNEVGNVHAGWGAAVFVSRDGVETEWIRLHGPVVLNPN